jgi:hypothetical protein
VAVRRRAAWLPNGVALYIAGSYAVAAMVGLGLSYATIPCCWRAVRRTTTRSRPEVC